MSDYWTDERKKEISEFAEEVLKMDLFGDFSKLERDVISMTVRAPWYKKKGMAFIYRWEYVDDYGTKHVYVGQSIQPVKRWFDEIKESPYKNARAFLLFKTFRKSHIMFAKAARFRILAEVPEEATRYEEAKQIRAIIKEGREKGWDVINNEAKDQRAYKNMVRRIEEHENY